MAWLSGWNYRKKITFYCEGDSAGADNQLFLKIGESSGASGYNFHLENHSASFPSGKNQGGDLRFTSSNGTTLLDFWVESVSGSSPNRLANIWVKVTDYFSSYSYVDIYCYYGNSSATNYSNGDNTFILFDDFDGSSLDTNKWTGIGTYSINNSIISLGGGSSYGKIVSNTTYGIYCAAHNYFRTEGYDSVRNCVAFTNDYTADGQRITIISSYFYLQNKNGGIVRNELISSANTSWNIAILKRSYDRSIGVVNNGSASNIYNYSTNNFPVFIGFGDNSNYKIYCDWVFVRKALTYEPYFYSASSEELPPKNTNNFFLFF